MATTNTAPKTERSITAIEPIFDTVNRMSPESLVGDHARSIAGNHINELAALKDDASRKNAAAMMGAIASKSEAYRSALESVSPTLAAETAAAYAPVAERKLLRSSSIASTFDESTLEGARQLESDVAREAAAIHVKELDDFADPTVRREAVLLVSALTELSPDYKAGIADASPAITAELKAANVEIESNEDKHLGTIESDAERIRALGKDTLSHDDATEGMNGHLEALSNISNTDRRFFAAAAMADLAEQDGAYREVLYAQHPAIVAEVEAAAREDRRRAAEKEERKASGATPLEPTARQRYEAEVRQRAQQSEDVHQARPPKSNEPQQPGTRDPSLTPPAANSVDVQRSGRELERPELIMPRRIVQTYSEVDGKFFAKDSNRLMFEDKGEKLATSGTNKELIADMVTLARAKQWESLKLTGSQEFRREAWLQAESQGLKTQGYTPKAEDLAALQVLTHERSTNSITPLQERKPQQQADRVELERSAPRHNINKNQAAMHAEASKNIATNVQALGKKPGMADRSTEELTKLAYWRGIVQEENKHQPTAIQEEAVARFDTQAQDPQFVKKIDQETRGSIDDKTTDRAQKRATPELSL